MTTSNFQKAGEWCESCRDRWDAKKASPMEMVALPEATERYHSEVAVCPYCDGDPIIKFAEFNFWKDFYSKKGEEKDPDSP